MKDLNQVFGTGLVEYKFDDGTSAILSRRGLREPVINIIRFTSTL